MKKKTEPEIILREHTYDGIEEFDQKLPNWWLFTLYITIVLFVVVWVAYYQTPLGIRSDWERIDHEVALIEKRREEQLKEMIASIDNESLMAMSAKRENVDSGKVIYEAKCLACHGPDLDSQMGGMKLPGVSLVDSEWLYGGSPLAIMTTVTEGSPDPTKGMIAWKSQLSAADIAKVTAYVLARQPEDYDPANAPALHPRDQLIGEEPAAAAES